MFIIRIIILLLVSSSFLQAKYYKCFYSKDDVTDYFTFIALFIEDNYISIMDNVYHINADLVSQGKDENGEYNIYKKEDTDFLYQVKLYKNSLNIILTRKNYIDNKIFQDTLYKCQDPDNLKTQDSNIPIIISPPISKN